MVLWNTIKHLVPDSGFNSSVALLTDDNVVLVQIPGAVFIVIYAMLY